MGGRTSMHLALTSPSTLHSLVVVDVSPVNQVVVVLVQVVVVVTVVVQVLVVDKSSFGQEFDATSTSQWNMEHFFHCLKAVTFDQDLGLSAARKDADRSRLGCMPRGVYGLDCYESYLFLHLHRPGTFRDAALWY